MLKGKVVRAAGGFFAVCDDSGKEYLCRARGMLKRGNEALMVGDLVLFNPGEKASAEKDGDGIIEKRLPRSNRLSRPPVANVDQLVVVISLKHPDCDWQLASRMLVLAEKENMTAFICLNKSDLANSDELTKLEERINCYPYPVIYTSALTGKGISTAADRLKGYCSVFAGPSGVGKSSLLNAVQPGLSLQTGTLSDKIKRGRHTTRQAALLQLDSGGTVVDTPGFSRLEFSGIDPENLADHFPEFDALQGSCNFRDCKHTGEPGCAVEPEIGKSINLMRYEHYRLFLDEINEQEAY